MQLRWVYKCLPVFIFYNEIVFRMFSKQSDGVAIGPIIFIRPDTRQAVIERALIEHELVHSRQSYRWIGINGILYLCSKKWRLKFEVEAYREQLKYVPERLNKFANALSTNYKLNITFDEAKALLLK
jgi:hypothetical protein